jgi:microcin C transport system substrate-binding protein
MVIAPMKRNLAKLGIKAKIRLVDENQYVIRVNEFDYDVIINVFGQALLPANEQYAYWHSSSKNTQGSRNVSGVDNKAVDYLLLKILNIKNKTELETYTKALDRILLWNHYVIPQWYNNSYRILYKNKFGIPLKSPLYSIGIDSWWGL